MPLVTRTGFADSDSVEFVELDSVENEAPQALHVSNDIDAEALAPFLNDVKIIRIPFPSARDGRGFSLARRLRDLGFRGNLRAQGHVISDQYRFALQCGFDEIEISDELAARQPEAFWRANDNAPNYRRKLIRRIPNPAFVIPDGVYAEPVTEVEHYTDTLFRFRIKRPQSLRFRSGQFVMIGLPGEDAPVYRAYSIASPSWDDELEFYSIKAPDGKLTTRLQKIKPGDKILMKKNSTGTLVTDSLTPGKRLYLLATGTGLAPFASLVRDPETYEKFDEVILIHTARLDAELEYGRQIVDAALNDPLIGELARTRLVYRGATTREPSPFMGRITDLIESERLFAELGVPSLQPSTDRVMLCGSMAMLKDLKAMCEARGFTEGAANRPADFVVERAFVD